MLYDIIKWGFVGAAIILIIVGLVMRNKKKEVE